jgi:TPR repeat protein
LAADQGDPQALYNLGVLHQDDTHHEANFGQALACFRLAASRGHDEAKVALGWLYARGLGVLQDYIRAHMWFNLGAISGHSEAIKGRDFVAQQMIAPQIAAAQDMARMCLQANFQGYD